MRPSIRFAIVIAGLLFIADISHAQLRGGFGQRPGVAFQIRTGPYNSLTYVAGAYGFGFGPIYGPIPSWYYGQPGIPIINNPFVSQPPVIINNNIIQASPVAAPAQPLAGGPMVPPEFGQLPAPGAKPRQRAAKPMAPKGAAIMPDPPKPPKAAGRADADRIVEAARKAFTEDQYGRAAELFGRAAAKTPNEPSAQWLVSQAYFALGKYREAVQAIAAGMALRADWPEARYVARDLYWKSPEVFDEHLKALREAVAAYPEDATLLFLLGHQLWFDGKHEEAKTLILKAKALGKGTTPADGFFK